MNNIKLKICGVKTAQEAKQLADLGIDYIGLNFVPTSSRCISLEAAEKVIEAIASTPLQTVALFRNQTLEQVNRYARRLKINYVQLHGNETADYAKNVQAPMMKAIPVSNTMSESDVVDYIDRTPANYYVLDRSQQGRGPIINSELASQIVAVYPDKIFLAGGLTPDNLPGIIKKVQPYGIDISSGVRLGDKIDVGLVKKCQKILQS